MNLLDRIEQARVKQEKRLDLSDMRLRVLPPQLFTLTELEELVLDENELTARSDERREGNARRSRWLPEH